MIPDLLLPVLAVTHPVYRTRCEGLLLMGAAFSSCKGDCTEGPSQPVAITVPVAVTVFRIDGAQIECSVLCTADTVKVLKSFLAEQEGIPRHTQSLYLEEDSNTELVSWLRCETRTVWMSKRVFCRPMTTGWVPSYQMLAWVVC